MNNKNTGIEYEKLIQTIFSQMQGQDLVKTINIQQDIIIQGKTIKHQVDVYWEFEVGGITYKTIVQAKDWNSKVKQEQLLSFAQVLADIPGQPRGIFVTKTGYQKGAKEFAQQNNICLYELREPTEKDWEGRMRNLEFNITLSIPHIDKVILMINKDWIEKNGDFIKDTQDLSSLFPLEMPLYDENNVTITTISEIIKKYITTRKTETQKNIHHIFNNPTFIKIEPQNVLLKIDGFTFELTFSQVKEKFKICGDNIIKYFLIDVFNQSITTIDHNLNIKH
jgi:hypothetical protein